MGLKTNVISIKNGILDCYAAKVSSNDPFVIYLDFVALYMICIFLDFIPSPILFDMVMNVLK